MSQKFEPTQVKVELTFSDKSNALLFAFTDKVWCLKKKDAQNPIPSGSFNELTIYGLPDGMQACFPGLCVRVQGGGVIAFPTPEPGEPQELSSLVDGKVKNISDFSIWVAIPNLLLQNLNSVPRNLPADYSWLTFHLHNAPQAKPVVSLYFAGKQIATLTTENNTWSPAQQRTPTEIPAADGDSKHFSAVERFLAIKPASVKGGSTSPLNVGLVDERVKNLSIVRLKLWRTFCCNRFSPFRAFQSSSPTAIQTIDLVQRWQEDVACSLGPGWVLRAEGAERRDNSTKKSNADIFADHWKELISSWNPSSRPQSTSLFELCHDEESVPKNCLPCYYIRPTTELNDNAVVTPSSVSYWLLPQAPKPASDGHNYRISFLSLRTLGGKPLTLTATAERLDDGNSHTKRSATQDIKETLDLKISNIQSTADDFVRAGALDLCVGGSLQDPAASECMCHFEFEPPQNPTWPVEGVIPLELSLYRIGYDRVSEGSQERETEEKQNRDKAGNSPVSSPLADAETIKIGAEYWAPGPSGLRIPVRSVRPGETDHHPAETELIDQIGGDAVSLDRPLVIPIDKSGSLASTTSAPEDEKLYLDVREIAGRSFTPFLELRLGKEKGNQEDKALSKQRTLYIDRCPFFICLFECKPITKFKTEFGNEVAYWSSKGVFRGWQLRATETDYDIILPPQGIGEEMEKGKEQEGYDDIGEGQLAEFRFTPPTKLTLASSDFQRRYGVVPWNLRLSLNSLRDTRLVGLPLTSAQFEMLYGLRMRIEHADYLRIAEIGARLGLPPRLIPTRPYARECFQDAKKLKIGSLYQPYVAYRNHWRNILQALNSRLAVYEVFDHRQADFDAKGEPAGLLLHGDATKDQLRAELRKEARVRTSFPDLRKSNPVVENMTSLIPNYADGLAGSFAWAFESKILYESLWTDPNPSTPDVVEAVEATLARLYFSALGGWSTQRASFNQGKLVIAVTVEMGRVSELRIEVIGRIANFWNKAKFVTVFRRSVLPSNQFADQQEEHRGRPILRKMDEYIEFLEKYRPAADAATRQVDPTLPGCVKGFSCYERIPCDSRWGIDVYDENKVAVGWKVPLRVPDAPDTIYGNPNLLIHFYADPNGPQSEVTGRITSLEKVWFWTDVRNETSLDSDTWPAVADLDAFPRPTDVPDTEQPEPIWAEAAANTFTLAPIEAEVALNHHLAPATRSAKSDWKPVGARLRTITLSRGASSHPNALDQLQMALKILFTVTAACDSAFLRTGTDQERKSEDSLDFGFLANALLDAFKDQLHARFRRSEDEFRRIARDACSGNPKAKATSQNSLRECIDCVFGRSTRANERKDPFTQVIDTRAIGTDVIRLVQAKIDASPTAINGEESIKGLLATEIPQKLSEWFDRNASEFKNQIQNTLEGKFASAASRKDWQQLLVSLQRGCPRGAQQSSLPPNDALALTRAWGRAPVASGLSFSARRSKGPVFDVAYYFAGQAEAAAKTAEGLASRVQMTRVKALVDRTLDGSGNVVEEVRHKAASLEMDVRNLGNKIEADVNGILEDAKKASTALPSLGEILPDIAGLKLEKLLRSSPVSKEFLERFRSATNLRHGFDRQTMTAFVDSEINALSVGQDLVIFDFPPVALKICNVRIWSHVRVETDARGATTRTAYGMLKGDWVFSLSGQPVVILADAALENRNGSSKMDIDPRKMRLASAFQAVSDAISTFRTSGNDPFTVGLRTDSIGDLTELVAHSRFNLDIPAAQALTSGVSNLSVGLIFELGLRCVTQTQKPTADGLRVSAGVALSSREAPFICSIFVLGGCGWLTLRADYIVPFEKGKASELAIYLNTALGVSACLAINLGFASGAVYAALSIDLEFWKPVKGNSPSALRYNVVFTLGGAFNILGIITVNLVIVLAVSYQSPGPLIGSGRLVARIRICWLFTLTIDKTFTKRFDSADFLAHSMDTGHQPTAVATRRGQTPIHTPMFTRVGDSSNLHRAAARMTV